MRKNTQYARNIDSNERNYPYLLYTHELRASTNVHYNVVEHRARILSMLKMKYFKYKYIITITIIITLHIMAENQMMLYRMHISMMSTSHEPSFSCFQCHQTHEPD